MEKDSFISQLKFVVYFLRNCIYAPLMVGTVFFVLSSCVRNTHVKNSATIGYKVKLEYAKGFSITVFDNYKLIRIFNPKDTSRVISEFKLFPKSFNGHLSNNEFCIPVSKVICLSSTQLAYFIGLNSTKSIVGLNNSKYLFNPEVRKAIKTKKIKRVGKEGNFNTELILGINPEIILVSPFKTGGYDVLKNIGIPLIPIAAYNEISPLGRAEWIKLIALLVGKEYQGDSIFNDICFKYNKLKQKVQNVKYKPSVFSGKLKAGSWYVPGGNSFIAHILRDAGANYIYHDNRQGAHPLDFEAVYNSAHDADFWRLQISAGVGFNSDMLVAEDIRYADFDAFKKGNILVCNIRFKPYYEENPIKPHVILADFINYFHPSILRNYKPTFYERLK